MSERYNIATIANDFLKAGLLLASDSMGNLVLLGINSTCKAIEIALGFASYYFNHVTHAITHTNKTCNEIIGERAKRARHSQG